MHSLRYQEWVLKSLLTERLFICADAVAGFPISVRLSVSG